MKSGMSNLQNCVIPHFHLNYIRRYFSRYVPLENNISKLICMESMENRVNITHNKLDQKYGYFLTMHHKVWKWAKIRPKSMDSFFLKNRPIREGSLFMRRGDEHFPWVTYFVARFSGAGESSWYTF